jgi:hypothetical protein
MPDETPQPTAAPTPPTPVPTNPQSPDGVEPGKATTEYVLTWVVLICGVITTSIGAFWPTGEMPDWARAAMIICGSLVTALQGGSYVIGRSIRKKGITS